MILSWSSVPPCPTSIQFIACQHGMPSYKRVEREKERKHFKPFAVGTNCMLSMITLEDDWRRQGLRKNSGCCQIENFHFLQECGNLFCEVFWFSGYLFLLPANMIVSIERYQGRNEHIHLSRWLFHVYIGMDKLMKHLFCSVASCIWDDKPECCSVCFAMMNSTGLNN